jgi:hypothetical protein
MDALPESPKPKKNEEKKVSKDSRHSAVLGFSRSSLKVSGLAIPWHQPSSVIKIRTDFVLGCAVWSIEKFGFSVNLFIAFLGNG